MTITAYFLEKPNDPLAYRYQFVVDTDKDLIDIWRQPGAGGEWELKQNYINRPSAPRRMWEILVNGGYERVAPQLDNAWVS